MSDGGLTVLDGTILRDIELRLPDTNGAVTGAELLSIAETETSSSLFGLSLPETLKSNALKRIHIDAVNFSSKEFDKEEASSLLKDYVIAIADELKDDPLVVSVLDGSPLRLFLEDEDDFAMLAENLFTDLDVVDKGKIQKKEIRNALHHMGVELGVPPLSAEFPVLDDILKKHGAEGEEELGQAQFAESLQPVLQDLADALSAKNIVIIQNIKISNGSKLRKLLADEEELNNVIEQILVTDDAKDEKVCTQAIRASFEKNGPMMGLPPLKPNDVMVLLYDQVFAAVDEKNSGDIGRDKCVELVKSILEKFAEVLEANPILHDL
ncbi:hypothetical protein AQUCO_04900121v1 [Aquilegia coerulea]|uniref:EF-hand domain-containing protein n=1 Tax=Aquilegia coerulea TaxID=218851 RepID=A0A2G5CK05_AQUCA|nr:hypothetical protein AQUCO_04900121v1 [Aquilegia coerulea]